MRRERCRGGVILVSKVNTSCARQLIGDGDNYNVAPPPAHSTTLDAAASPHLHGQLARGSASKHTPFMFAPRLAWLAGWLAGWLQALALSR